MMNAGKFFAPAVAAVVAVATPVSAMPNTDTSKPTVTDDFARQIITCQTEHPDAILYFDFEGKFTCLTKKGRNRIPSINAPALQ